MEDVQRIPVPGWMTMDEAAQRLGITRQAARQVALRLGWERGRIGDLLLVSRPDVEYYHQRRRPPRPAPAPAPAPAE